ncbi:MAG: sulfur carrier protein ThiS [Deltaproteobacteria bacterium]|nr:sulfur carrier protein ThiS [Deltaproteobacteria bacterium]
MNITVNGKPSKIEPETSIVILLNQYNIKSPMTIVEINETVVPKEQWMTHTLEDGDNVEIIQLMGGG